MTAQQIPNLEIRRGMLSKTSNKKTISDWCIFTQNGALENQNLLCTFFARFEQIFHSSNFYLYTKRLSAGSFVFFPEKTAALFSLKMKKKTCLKIVKKIAKIFFHYSYSCSILSLHLSHFKKSSCVCKAKMCDCATFQFLSLFSYSFRHSEPIQSFLVHELFSFGCLYFNEIDLLWDLLHFNQENFFVP